MRIEATLTEFTQASPECLFLPAEAGLKIDGGALEFERSAIIELTAEVLAIMGLSETLRPGGEYPDDIIPKPHHLVANREAAVAEQFYHPDVATNGFCGIFLIGLEGDDPNLVPETQVVDNEAMTTHVHDLVSGGPLSDRLEDIVVVRPFFDPQNRAEWMNLPRHSLERLGSKFEDLLTPAQAEHVNRERQKVTDTSKYTGDVFISELVASSLIDGSPLVTCGVAQRELRLALKDDQTTEETQALTELHDDITRYLLDPSAPFKAKKVVEGSAIFVPKDQLHRATPYLPQYHRSVVGVRCYAQPGKTPPESWRRAYGTDY